MEVSHRREAVIEGWEQDYLSAEDQRQAVCALARAGDTEQLVASGFPADMVQVMCAWQQASAPDVVGSFLHPEGLDAAYLYGALNAAGLHERAPDLRIRLLHLDTVGYRKHSESPFNFGSFGVPLNMFGVVEVGKAAVANSALYAPRAAEVVQQRLDQFNEAQPSVVQRIFSQVEPHIESAIRDRQVRHKRKEIREMIRAQLEERYADLAADYSGAVQASLAEDASVYMSELLYRYKAAVSRRVVPELQQLGIEESLFSADAQLLPLVRQSIDMLVASRGVDFLRQIAEPNEGLCLMAPQNITRQMLVVDEQGRFKVVGDGQESYVSDEAVPAILARGLPLAKLFVASLVASGSVYHLGSEQAEQMRECIIEALGVEDAGARNYLLGLHMGENGGYANKGVKLKGSRSVISLPLLYLLMGPQGLREFVAVRQGRRSDPLELSVRNLARQAGRYLVGKAVRQMV